VSLMTTVNGYYLASVMSIASAAYGSVAEQCGVERSIELKIAFSTSLCLLLILLLLLERQSRRTKWFVSTQTLLCVDLSVLNCLRSQWSIKYYSDIFHVIVMMSIAVVTM